MEQFRHFVSALLILHLLSQSMPAFQTDALRPNQVSAIESAAKAMMKDQQAPSVVVMVHRNGKQVFARAWGLRNVEDRLTAGVDTLYQYGSLTKQITAMAVFLLAQDGKLSLDDRVDKFLPEFKGRAATVKQLLIHSSGTKDFIDENPRYMADLAPQMLSARQWAIEFAAKQEPNFPPGTKAQYSNSGYLMLSAIVEKVSGQPFEQFLQKRIFEPLEMSTVKPYKYFPVTANTAAGYVVWNKEYAEFMKNGMASQGAELAKLVHAPPWNIRQAEGAGFLVGDAAALQKWGNGLLSGKLLSKKWAAAYFSSGVLNNGSPAYAGPAGTFKDRPSFAYGGLANFKLNGHTIHAANGGTFGFSTFTGIIPALQISVTTLTNLGEADNGKLTVPIVEALLK